MKNIKVGCKLYCVRNYYHGMFYEGNFYLVRETLQQGDMIYYKLQFSENNKYNTWWVSTIEIEEYFKVEIKLNPNITIL